MTPFDAIVGGGAAGFLGGILAHILTTIASRYGAEGWLRGPYGTQFFPLALYLGVLYGAIAFAAKRTAKNALIGFSFPFLMIVVPMAVLTHLELMKDLPRGETLVWSWFWVVIIVQTVALWGGLALIGAVSSGTKAWRGAVAAVLGSLTGYGLLSLFLWAVPSYGKGRWDPRSFVPSPVTLMDGLLSGLCLCLALSLDAKISGGTPHDA